MELALGTAAVGFAALAAQEIEGANHHGLLALQGAEGAAQSRIGQPELLTAAGKIVAHVCIPYMSVRYR